MKLTQEEAQTRYEYAKTRAIEEGDCLIWQGALHKGQPVMRTSVGTVSVRRVALIARGVSLGGQMRATCRCGDPRCIAPGHVMARPHAACIKRGMDKMSAASKSLRSLRISRKRQPTAKITPERLAILRSEDRPSLTELARQWGVRRETLSAALSGRLHKRRDANPWAGLEAGLLRP